MAAEVPTGEIVAAQADARQIVGLIAGRGIQRAEVNPSDVALLKNAPRTSAPVRSASVSVALVRLAELRLMPVSVAELRDELVRFWPARFQPVRLLLFKPMPVKLWPDSWPSSKVSPR